MCCESSRPRRRRSPVGPELEFTLRELLNGRISHGGQIFNAKLNPERAGRAGARDVLSVAPSVEKRCGPCDNVLRRRLRWRDRDAVPPRRHPTAAEVRIIGLGAGTLALYGQPGDTIRYFEINPDVATVAGRYFTFLSDCRRRGVNLKIVFGDGRLSLQKEPPKSLDILVVDAFNGDAIPVHLLTEEAFSLYLTRLRDDGVLAIHVSNRHLSLTAGRSRILAHLGVPEVLVHHHPDAREQALLETEWVLLSRNRSFLDSPAVKPYFVGTPTALPAGQPWTDDFSSLFRVVRW